MDEKVPMGYLTVRVTSGALAYPVEGAIVLIKNNDTESGDTGVIISRRTDGSGLTQSMTLPAADASLSESPGNESPFISYSVEVIKDGYYRSLINEVQLYEGISATLPVNLVPLGAGAFPYGGRDVPPGGVI